MATPRFFLHELPDKGPIVAYQAATLDEALTAGVVVQKVFRGYSAFHQIGSIPAYDNQPSFHGWELWRPIDDETLQRLLAECEVEYEKLSR